MSIINWLTSYKNITTPKNLDQSPLCGTLNCGPADIVMSMRRGHLISEPNY